jgi:hypothetical protein
MRPYFERNPSQKGAGRVAQSEGPEFKPHETKQKHQKSKKERKKIN